MRDDVSPSPEKSLAAAAVLVLVGALGCQPKVPEIDVEPEVLNASQLAVSGVVYTEIAPDQFIVKVLRPEADDRVIHSIVERGGVVSLYVERISGLDMEEVARLRGLRELHLARSDIEEIKDMSELQHLERLDLRSTRVRSIRALKSLSALRWLDLSETPVDDLWPLFENETLEVLKLRSTRVKEIEPLQHSTALQELDISYTAVRDISDLAGLPNLRKLDLSGTRVRDLSPLARMPALEEVDLFGTDEVADFSVITRATTLKRVNVQRTRVSEDQVRTLRAAMPGTQIVVSEAETENYGAGWP